MREKATYVRLNEVEREMAKEVMQKLGFEKTPDLLRYLLRSKWEELNKIEWAKKVEGGGREK